MQANENFELLAILLVSHGSSGSHLLFKYPFSVKQNPANSSGQSGKRSQFSLVSNDGWTIEKEQKLIVNGVLSDLDNTIDSVLANLCIINRDKLELKIDNVYFLAAQPILRINEVVHNIVFAVRSPLPRPVIKCYQSLSLAIANALLKEDANTQFLSYQSQMLTDSLVTDQNLKTIDANFEEALRRSILAQHLKTIYENVRKDGKVNVLINNCVRLSFCLPHLAYRISEKCEQTQFVEVLFNATSYLKPYLGFILLERQEEVLKSLPLNCNFYTRRLVEIYNCSFSLARYAAELDVAIEEVYLVLDHLIYWAKVKVVYPISESNIYVIHPSTDLVMGNKLVEDFNLAFPGYTFQEMVSRFSFAKPLVDHLDPTLSKEKQAVFVDMLLWLLSRNALMQLHTYIFLLPKKIEHVRLGGDNFSKFSDLSFEEENDLSLTRNGGGGGGGMGSEHSNDTEMTDFRDSAAVYDEYREIFREHRVAEKDQQYMFKAFEQKTEQDIKLFVQLMPYYKGLHNLEAIMYYEKLNRSDLITFLDKFKDILMVSNYEDPNPLVRVNVRVN